MKKALMLIIGIIIIASLCSCDGISSKQPKNIELVSYIGKSLSTVETELSAELKDMTQYFDSAYRFEAGTTLVDFSIDSSGKIVRIHLWDSGELGYTLCGLTTEMDDVSAENKLSENGAVFVRGKVWQCANKTDCITREDSGWIYMANSEILEEQLLLAKMENALAFQHEDSEGIYYIGNHQFVEYYYSSFPRFVHEYKNLTEYQQGVWNETIAGRYLMVSGTVTGVTERGTIIVMCEDQSYGEEVGNILPTVGFAELTLVSEQEALLMSLSENSSIVAFGQILPESYNGVYFDLSETIVLEVNSSSVMVPVLERLIPGLTRFDESGNILQGANMDVNFEGLNCPFFFADTIFEQLSENALLTTQFLEDKYIKLIGKISYFHTDGEFFSVSSVSGYYSSDKIVCNISKEHQDRLTKMKIGDFITLYCKITNVDSLAGYTINADVITFEDENNRYICGKQPLEYEAFWNQPDVTTYYDEITREYMDPATFGFISIFAGKTGNSEVTYWLSLQTGSEIREIDGGTREIAQYIDLPSKEIWTESNRVVVEFAVEGYCEYTGKLQLIKEYRENGYIVDYLYADIPGLLSTSNTAWYLGAT